MNGLETHRKNKYYIGLMKRAGRVFNARQVDKISEAICSCNNFMSSCSGYDLSDSIRYSVTHDNEVFFGAADRLAIAGLCGVDRVVIPKEPCDIFPTYDAVGHEFLGRFYASSYNIATGPIRRKVEKSEICFNAITISLADHDIRALPVLSDIIDQLPNVVEMETAYQHFSAESSVAGSFVYESRDNSSFNAVVSLSNETVRAICGFDVEDPDYDKSAVSYREFSAA